MKICRKLLRLKTSNLLFFFSVLVFTNCSKEQKKEDFIARVNDSYLTREEFASLVDTTNLNPIDRKQVIKNWIFNELLYQKAKDEDITDLEEFKNVMKTSSKELAAAMLLNNYVSSEDIKFSDSDLRDYYEKDKNYFQLNADSYLINKITFDSEDNAIKFRSLAIESDWTKASNFFSSDTSIISKTEAELIQGNNLYPYQLMKIAKDMYPGEISIVVVESDGYYSVIQILGKYEKGTIPNYEIIKYKVEKRFLAEKKKQLIDEYLNELYSHNDIEIKK
jgi:hypothetical protein